MTNVSAIPATPNAGTADTNPLLTIARYQFITNDSVSTAPNFAMALADALDMLQRAMDRTFLYAQYTERLYVYKNGQCYPSATPLDQSKPVGTSSDPSGQSSSFVIQGAGIYVGFFNPLPALPVFSRVVPMQADVAYWGGYTQTTIPATLARVIAKVCWFILHPVTAPAAGIGGARSVSVGGVSVSGDLSSFMASDRDLRRDIEDLTRRQARSWQA